MTLKEKCYYRLKFVSINKKHAIHKQGNVYSIVYFTFCCSTITITPIFLLEYGGYKFRKNYSFCFFSCFSTKLFIRSSQQPFSVLE